jgi:hypothetical protein
LGKRFMLVAEHILWVMTGLEDGEEMPRPTSHLAALGDDLATLERLASSNSDEPLVRVYIGAEFRDFDQAWIVDLATGAKIREWNFDTASFGDPKSPLSINVFD